MPIVPRPVAANVNFDARDMAMGIEAQLSTNIQEMETREQRLQSTLKISRIISLSVGRWRWQKPHRSGGRCVAPIDLDSELQISRLIVPFSLIPSLSSSLSSEAHRKHGS